MKTRTFKFRAWYPAEKKFVNDFVIDNLGNYYIKDETETYYIFYQWDNCEIPGLNKYLIVSQFTGLLDKNGKEIYEGDLLKHTIESKNIMAVVYQEHSFILKCVNRKQNIYYGYMDLWEMFEVIGNVYENPELIEEKNV